MTDATLNLSDELSNPLTRFPNATAELLKTSATDPRAANGLKVLAELAPKYPGLYEPEVIHEGPTAAYSDGAVVLKWTRNHHTLTVHLTTVSGCVWSYCKTGHRPLAWCERVVEPETSLEYEAIQLFMVAVS